MQKRRRLGKERDGDRERERESMIIPLIVPNMESALILVVNDDVPCNEIPTPPSSSRKQHITRSERCILIGSIKFTFN